MPATLAKEGILFTGDSYDQAEMLGDAYDRVSMVLDFGHVEYERPRGLKVSVYRPEPAKGRVGRLLGKLGGKLVSEFRRPPGGDYDFEFVLPLSVAQDSGRSRTRLERMMVEALTGRYLGGDDEYWGFRREMAGVLPAKRNPITI